jgi:hypothetical protein
MRRLLPRVLRPLSCHHPPLYRHPNFFAEKHQDPARLKSRACVKIKVSTIAYNTNHPTQGLNLQ